MKAIKTILKIIIIIIVVPTLFQTSFLEHKVNEVSEFRMPIIKNHRAMIDFVILNRIQINRI